jgi:hypothetical protein
MGLKQRVTLTIVVALGLIAVGAAIFTAHRDREKTRAMRASVAKLGLPELLRRQHACERDFGLNRAYCLEVTHTIAAQPLQMVEIPPDTTPPPEPVEPAAYEHDPRSIVWGAKATP